MKAILNQYFPNDISNIILDIHYRSMFYNVINQLKMLIEDCKQGLEDIDVYDMDEFMTETGNTFAQQCFEQIKEIKRYQIPWDNRRLQSLRMIRSMAYDDDYTDQESDDKTNREREDFSDDESDDESDY